MDRERISALLDGELDEGEMRRVIVEIAADAQLARTWQRYHLIRAGLRREDMAASEALCERIASRLDQEPVVLAPGNTAPRRPVAGRGGRWLALAASLAMVSAAGWWLLAERQGASRLPDPGLANLAAKAPKRDVEPWRDRPEVAEQLNTLLVRHGEFTPALGMNGLAAYAKFVSHDVRP